MQGDGEPHQINLADRISGVMEVVGSRQHLDQMRHGCGIIIGRRIELDNGGKDLLHQQTDAFAALGRGQKFAAGHRVVLPHEGKNLPRDKGEISPGGEGEMADNHGAQEHDKDEAMGPRHRRGPARHGRPVAEGPQDKNNEKKLARDSQQGRSRRTRQRRPMMTAIATSDSGGSQSVARAALVIP